MWMQLFLQRKEGGVAQASMEQIVACQISVFSLDIFWGGKPSKNSFCWVPVFGKNLGTQQLAVFGNLSREMFNKLSMCLHCCLPNWSGYSGFRYLYSLKKMLAICHAAGLRAMILFWQSSLSMGRSVLEYEASWRKRRSSASHAQSIASAYLAKVSPGNNEPFGLDVFLYRNFSTIAKSSRPALSSRMQSS